MAKKDKPANGHGTWPSVFPGKGDVRSMKLTPLGHQLLEELCERIEMRSGEVVEGLLRLFGSKLTKDACLRDEARRQRAGAVSR